MQKPRIQFSRRAKYLLDCCRVIKNKVLIILIINTLHIVGVTGFEPATPWSQTRCATGLRYAPNIGATTARFLLLQISDCFEI